MAQSNKFKRNKASSLLSKEHNELIFLLLGSRCISLATTPVHLRVSHFASGLSWTKKEEDVLCFVKDYNKRNFYFRLYSLKRDCLIWEKSIIKFYAFEVTDCLVNFDFSNDQEANEMREIVKSKLLKYKSKSRSILQNPNGFPEEPIKKPKIPGILFSKKPPKTISKRDIGGPIAVQHLNSIAWNRNTGLSVHRDPHLDKLLGITPSEKQSYLEITGSQFTSIVDERLPVPIPDIIKELGGLDEFSRSEPINDLMPRANNWGIGDVETRHFIYDFINQALVMDKDNDEAATREFIYNFIQSNSGNGSSAEMNSRKLRPPQLPPPPRPPLPPPRAPNTHISTLSESLTGAINNDVPAGSSKEQQSTNTQVSVSNSPTAIDYLSESDQDIGIKQFTLDCDSGHESLISLLKAALAQRTRAFHSDGSEET